VEEILRSLIESGVLVKDEGLGEWRGTQERVDVPLPDTLHGLLAAPIDRLEPASRRVLQMASVVGRIFSYRVLAAITDRSPLQAPGKGAHPRLSRGTSALDCCLLTLQRAQLIHERSRTPELVYVFKHDLAREAAYNGLPLQQRRAYHRQVAQALEKLYTDRIEEYLGLLAHHWQQAEETEQAMEYLVCAGEQARAAYANEEAIDYYRRVLVLLEDRPPGASGQHARLTALRGLGIVCFGMGRLEDAENSMREAIALAQESGLEAHALACLYYWLGEVFFLAGARGGDDSPRRGGAGAPGRGQRIDRDGLDEPARCDRL
jgi:predicted ATPase